MPSRGVLYMVLSAFGFSAMAVLVKLVSARTCRPARSCSSRAVMTLALSYVMVRRAGLSPWGTQRSKLLLRGLLGFAALACYYIALARLPLADATTLQHASRSSRRCSRGGCSARRIGWAAAFAIACGIGGVLLRRPSRRRLALADPVGVAIALGSATLSAFAYVTVRQLAQHRASARDRLLLPARRDAARDSVGRRDFVVPSAPDWLLLLGDRRDDADRPGVHDDGPRDRAGRARDSVGYIQICFAMIWQLAIFGEAPAFGTLAGAALIIAGTLAVSATATRAAASARTAT